MQEKTVCSTKTWKKGWNGRRLARTHGRLCGAGFAGPNKAANVDATLMGLISRRHLPCDAFPSTPSGNFNISHRAQETCAGGVATTGGGRGASESAGGAGSDAGRQVGGRAAAGTEPGQRGTRLGVVAWVSPRLSHSCRGNVRGPFQANGLLNLQI